MVERTLINAGYGVKSTNSPAEAKRMIRANQLLHFDMMVTDVFMRGTTGTTLAAIARDLRSSVEVLFMSGDPTAARRQMDSDETLLRKPFTQTELLAQLERLGPVRSQVIE